MINIYEFLCSVHPNGRNGFTDDGFNHYMNILSIICNKMFNPEKPESKFVELCFNEEWDYAYAIADSRNKEAIKFCNLFYKFIEYVKSTPEYISFDRNIKISKLINNI